MLTILSPDEGFPVPQYSGDISDGGTFQRVNWHAPFRALEYWMYWMCLPLCTNFDNKIIMQMGFEHFPTFFYLLLNCLFCNFCFKILITVTRTNKNRIDLTEFIQRDIIVRIENWNARDDLRSGTRWEMLRIKGKENSRIVERYYPH